MFYALSWFTVFALLSLWSLAAWLLHGVAVWTVSNAGALSGAASKVGSISLPDWLAPWVPAELAQVLPQVVEALAPLVGGLLEAAPALAGGLTVAAWVVWALGALLLLVLGAVLHVVIAMWRRRAGGHLGPSLAAS